ncbi:MAG: hypothetical protein J6Q86_04210 [Methanobrevibacter sp.]|nr:hypothetical protein [Methanobrevibacter sp.]
MKLNVYNKDGEVIKTVEGNNIDIKFGHIRSIMKLLNVDNIDDTYDLLNSVYSAWEKLTEILSECFPEMEEEDWENVRIKELIPELIQIIKDSFAEILTIPKEKN